MLSAVFILCGFARKLRRFIGRRLAQHNFYQCFFGEKTPYFSLAALMCNDVYYASTQFRIHNTGLKLTFACLNLIKATVDITRR